MADKEEGGQYDALIKALSAGSGNSVADVLSNRRSKAYATNPWIGAYRSMGRVPVTDTQSGIADAATQIVGALMAARGIRQAETEYDDYTAGLYEGLKGGQKGIDALDNARYGDAKALLTYENRKREDDARVKLASTLAEKGMILDENGQLQALPGYTGVMAGQEAAKEYAKGGLTYDPETGGVKLVPGFAAAEGEKARAKDMSLTSFSLEKSAMSDVRGLPQFKLISEAAPAFNTLMNLATDKSGASDIPFIAAVAKIHDPGSVVREGEIIMQDSRGRDLLQRFAGQINLALKGETSLGDDVKKEMIRAAAAKLGELQEGYNQAVDATIYPYVRQGLELGKMKFPHPVQPGQTYFNLGGLSRSPRLGAGVDLGGYGQGIQPGTEYNVNMQGGAQPPQLPPSAPPPPPPLPGKKRFYDTDLGKWDYEDIGG